MKKEIFPGWPQFRENGNTVGYVRPMYATSYPKRGTVGFTIFPCIMALVNKNQSYVECTYFSTKPTVIFEFFNASCISAEVHCMRHNG